MRGGKIHADRATSMQCAAEVGGDQTKVGRGTRTGRQGRRAEVGLRKRGVWWVNCFCE